MLIVVVSSCKFSFKIAKGCIQKHMHIYLTIIIIYIH